MVLEQEKILLSYSKDLNKTEIYYKSFFFILTMAFVSVNFRFIPPEISSINLSLKIFISVIVAILGIVSFIVCITMLHISKKIHRELSRNEYVYEIVFVILLTISILLNTLYFVLKIFNRQESILSEIGYIVFSTILIGDFCSDLLLKKQSFKEEKVPVRVLTTFIICLLLCFISFFTNKLLAIIFMSGIALILFVFIVKVLFISDIKLDKLYKILGLIIVLGFEILCTCVIIYEIFWDRSPDANQSVYTAIMGVYAGVLGGLLTLAGVSWTIKNQEKIRKEDLKFLYKPYFTFKLVDDYEQAENVIYIKIFEKTVSKNGKKDKNLLPNETYFYITNFELINTDYSNFIIERYEINNNNMLDSLVLIKKQEKVIFKSNVLLIYDIKTIPVIKIYLKDFLENHYVCDLSFDIIDKELYLRNGEIDKCGNHIEEKIKVKEMVLKDIKIKDIGKESF